MVQRELSGSRIILTGASSGIGWYLASRLIGQGAKVVVSGRREERLRRLRLSMGNPARLIAVAGDLCDAVHREQLVNAAVDAWGGIDILINNAGAGGVGRFEESPPCKLRQIFELDFFAAVELTRLSIPWLKRGSEPVICNISSVLAYRGVPLKSEYCAAKFALRGWSESLRVELIRDSVRVLMVAPSTTRSEFSSSLIGSNEALFRSSPWAQSSEAVAERVCRVLRTGRRESVLTFGGNAFVALSHWWPWATDRLLNRFAQ